MAYSICFFFLLTSCITLVIKNKNTIFFNPFFYLFFFSLVYLGLPFLYIEYTAKILGLDIGSNAFFLARCVSLFYMFVFLLGYCFNREKYIVKNVHYISWKSLFFLVDLLFAFFCSWLLIENFSVYFSSDRDSAYALHALLIKEYKLNFIMYYQAFYLYMTCFAKKHISFFIGMSLMLPLSILELSSGGRGVAYLLFLGVGFRYYNCVGDSLRLLRVRNLLLMVPMFALLLIRYFKTRDVYETGLDYFFYSFFAEFSHTSVTTPYLLSNPIAADFGFFKYLISNLLGPFRNILGANDDWYADVVSNDMGVGFGLAGNVISESFFYGGLIGTVIFPFVMLLIFNMIYRLCSNRWGAFYGAVLLLHIANTRLYFRGSFYDTIWAINYFCLILFFIYLVQTNLVIHFPFRRR